MEGWSLPMCPSILRLATQSGCIGCCPCWGPDAGKINLPNTIPPYCHQLKRIDSSPCSSVCPRSTVGDPSVSCMEHLELAPSATKTKFLN